MPIPIVIGWSLFRVHQICIAGHFLASYLDPLTRLKLDRGAERQTMIRAASFGFKPFRHRVISLSISSC